MRTSTFENESYDSYLQHSMLRMMPAVGCIKITRQAGILAIRANVDVHRLTINTVEKSANNVLMTTAKRVRENGTNRLRGSTYLKHSTSGCLRATKTEDMSRQWRRWMRSLTWLIRVVLWCGIIRCAGNRLLLYFQKWVYRVDVMHTAVWTA